MFPVAENSEANSEIVDPKLVSEPPLPQAQPKPRWVHFSYHKRIKKL